MSAFGQPCRGVAVSDAMISNAQKKTLIDIDRSGLHNSKLRHGQCFNDHSSAHELLMGENI